MHKNIFWFVGGVIIIFLAIGGFFLQSGKKFEVKRSDEKSEVQVPNGKKECSVAGCSNQLCVEKETAQEIGTTCEWLEEYGCYKEAKCEEQSDGQCGWTITEKLKSCIEHAREETNQSPVLESSSPPVHQVMSKTETKNTSEKIQPNSSTTLSVVKHLVSWGFSVSEERKIDTIILHSSYNPSKGEKYDTEAIIEIYKTYGVSPHYIIGRDGKITQLVSEDNVAYHAGVSALPDGRTNVNTVSLGIEMVNDDKGDEYTEKQYLAINTLIADIKARHAIKYILGHNDIASGRKTDPWNFDWKKVKK